MKTVESGPLFYSSRIEHLCIGRLSFFIVELSADIMALVSLVGRNDSCLRKLADVYRIGASSATHSLFQAHLLPGDLAELQPV